MMPGSRVPALQSVGSVTSTQNLMPSRGRVTWMRFVLRARHLGPDVLGVRDLACCVPAFVSRTYASGITVGDSCV